MPEKHRVKKITPEQRLARLLVRAEVVTREQVEEAFRILQERSDKPFGRILIEKGWCSEWAIARAMAKILQKRFVSVKKALLSQKVIQLVPKSVAVKYNVLIRRCIDPAKGLLKIGRRFEGFILV